MKVYRISKWAFGGICFLILLLPLSRHWKLLLRGERTRGTVTLYTRHYEVGKDHTRYSVKASEIEFQVEGITYTTYGPANYQYEKGRHVPVYYSPKNPDMNCVATFSAVYLTNYLAIPIILLMVWYAFYLSFNNYRKRIKGQKGPDIRKRNRAIEGLIEKKRSLKPGDGK